MDTDTRPRRFPDTVEEVGIGGLLAVLDEYNGGSWLLAERTDEDTWTSVGYVFTARDAKHIVEGWIAS